VNVKIRLPRRRVISSPRGCEGGGRTVPKRESVQLSADLLI
jgi:hypothetical protein